MKSRTKKVFPKEEIEKKEIKLEKWQDILKAKLEAGCTITSESEKAVVIFNPNGGYYEKIFKEK